MLDPAIAGGGPTINVATHFFDLFRFITSKEVSTVSAVMSSRTHGCEIEDYSIVTLQTDDGVVGVVESGYSFPSTPEEQREFSFSLGSSGHYAYSGRDTFHFRDRSNLATGTRTRPVRLKTDTYYPLFFRRILDECRTGSSPVAGLGDAESDDGDYRGRRKNGAARRRAAEDQVDMRSDKRNGDPLAAARRLLVTRYRQQPLTPSTPIPTRCDTVCAIVSRTSPTSVSAALEPMLVPGHFWPSREAAESDGNCQSADEPRLANRHAQSTQPRH